MSDAYLWLKLIHILGATLLFGLGLGTAFQMWMTHRRGDVAAIAGTARNVVIADWLFIATSGVAQPLSGLALIRLGGHDPLAPWLLVSYGLYVVAGLCWLPVVWLQLRIRDLAALALAEGRPLPPIYHRYMRLWFALGWPAFIGLLVVFAMMVLRPV